ncbi:MAG: PilZ domain-containing protein [Pyrinomonadaceae bacterium]
MQTLTSQRSGTVPPVTRNPENQKENRRIQRISLPLPVRVEVRIDVDNSWNEVTRLSDVSAFGAGFSLKKPVKRGRLVLLTIPMPRQLRSFDYSESQYKIWAVVRRCIEVVNGQGPRTYSVGAAFIGKSPPAGYLEHPSMLFDIAQREDDQGLWHVSPANLMVDESDLPTDLRKQTRYFIPEPLRIEKMDGDGNIIYAESTVTENISLGGAAIFATNRMDAGTFVRVVSDRFDVTILSVVRGSRIGIDGITRLHVEFVDRYFPLEGIV